MDMELYGVGMIPLIVGLIEVLKGIGFNQKYAPVASILFGVIFGFLAYMGEPIKATVVGISVGLAAVGLYSGVKNTVEK